MIVMHGHTVLEGTAEAPCSTGKPEENTVYICDQLTVPVVRRALDAGVSGIITNAGDYACHAANLLRSARTNGNSIVWVKGLVVQRATRVKIDADGICSFDSDAIVHATMESPEKQSIFRYQSGATSWKQVCLWPERRYKVDEFCLARSGLEICAGELCESKISVSLWRERVWFSNPAPSNTDLLEFALNQDSSVPYLERMSEEYAKIVDILKSGESSYDIPTIFFSTLLPFHKSYGTVIQNSLASHPNGNQIADVALSNGVVRWLYRTPQFTTSQKLAGDKRWDGLLPPETIFDYISDTESTVSRFAPEVEASKVHWLSLIAVVKEYKMIISKNLYARYLT
ncbi:hypothetical protein [Dietzia sp. PP-33]|jgi:hypothetical protein|uniref:hypothetical protein n=1 Tax=Dietzia sp. PP-33 TaxID=2957500 RepID=UPI0029AF2794|nr:hypothetical protein [Dietzia sp. PP-33]MDX2356157.1 hypothetical protein [Dietzia sp. PP-33]